MGAEKPAVYRFDRFVLDLVRGALLADEAECALRPKSFALLRHLVENPQRLIGRDEIMETVWPGVIVTEDSIAQCVKEIRRALSDDEQRLLRTLPRRGYLFAAQVSRAEAAVVRPTAATSPASSADAPRPPTGRPMVVVLPFDNIGSDPEQVYFVDGLTADLVTDLTRFQNLHVVSPHRHARQPQRALPEAPWAKPELPRGTAYLVSGSIRRAGGRIRATVQLEDARSGVSLWAERFDRSLDDLFAVQEELAERLAAHLVSQVEHDGIRRARRHPPASLDAYDLCLRGRELYGRANATDTLAAREMFAHAIDADPDYATAYAWQAFTVQRGLTHRWGEPRGPPAAILALKLARRAAEIEPGSPLCLAHLAFVLLLNAQWDEALETGRAAVLANPCALVTRRAYGDVLTHAGDAANAVQELRQALSLDPFYPPGLRADLGRALLLAGRSEEALVELRWCAAHLPDSGLCRHAWVVAAAETGRIEEARAAMRELLRLCPDLTTRNIGSIWFFRDPAVVERFRAAFRLVGFPGA